MNQPVKAIIIDDEPAARRLLQSMLQVHSEWLQIIAEASNGKEAIEQIDEKKPDLVFLDIQMPDFTGFEVLEKISHKPDVIFTTAYEQYAIKAFETFSIDYLLKPIREERLENALEKLKQFGRKAAFNDYSQLKKLVDSLTASKTPTAFPVRQGDKITLIRFETICFYEADDKYVSLFTTEGKKYLTDQTLTNLSQKLPSSFLRVQKSFIINKDKIREIRKHFNGRFVLIMDDVKQTRITTGLTFYETIKSELGL
jgi:two-component system LytT family response regulator